VISGRVLTCPPEDVVDRPPEVPELSTHRRTFPVSIFVMVFLLGGNASHAM